MSLAHSASHETNYKFVHDRGHKSNRDGIGARVKLTTAQGPQWATVTTSGSYLSAGDSRVHFGMGAEKAAQGIEIRWPSGIRQTLKNVPGDQFLVIEEPDAGKP